MKKQKKQERFKMKFLADLNFNLSTEEVWEELSSHNEKKKVEETPLPIKLHIIKSLNEIGTFLNKKNCIQLTLF
ncbi:MAG TPA: hypothetical protein PKW14_05515 [Bacteroidota bacterium]|jgi:hypothetical protein|nr:hypothetical protein [Bacteroidota bacterium]